MIEQATKQETLATVLVVEGAVLVRMAIAGYLRECGYRVIEASTSDEALLVLDRSRIRVDVIFSAVDVSGAFDGFALTRWVRTNHPQTKIVMAGSPKSASAAAGKLCEEGPHLKKPYEPQAVEDYIRRLLALAQSTEPQ
ncbi:response regulator [Hyphomicrobium sp. B1]|uniref:response regulator n=1 Tax=unclassified Hyphomicrobium TaxID=2619925 RepID=UPI0039189F79